MAGTAGQGGAKDAGPDAEASVASDATPDVSSDASADVGTADVVAEAAADSAPDVSVEAAAEAGTDAGADGSDGASALGPTAALLKAHSPACLTCVKSKAICNNLLTLQPCEGLTDNAAAGPATGQSKSSLCLALLTCELTTTCAIGANGSSDCYCGTIGANCFTTGGNGQCKSDIEKGVESTDPATIFAQFGDATLGGGRANNLIQCANDNSCDACF
jgi:hypothetical protein